MKVISIAELKRRLGAHLRAVRAGEELIVTDRGRPVAKMVPLAGDATEHDARVAELVRSGRARPPAAALPADLWERPRPPDEEGRGLEILLDERASGR